MSISIVRAALESRLSAWANAQSPPLPIAFQSVAFTKPDTTPYLECILIPNTTINREVTGTRPTELGLFQVNVWTPSGSGMGTAGQLVDSIVSLFPVTPKFSAVSVEQTPSPSPTKPDSASWNITPVLIKYRYESGV